MDCKKRKEQVFYLRLGSLLLRAVMNVELASAVRGWVCGPRYVLSHGGGCIN